MTRVDRGGRRPRPTRRRPRPAPRAGRALRRLGDRSRRRRLVRRQGACARSSRTTSRSCGARWRCTASSCSLVTGIYLTLFFEGSQQPRRVRRLLPPAPGRRGVGRLRLGVADLVRRQGRPADPPDAPLGGARVRRGDRPAHGPGLLHRRVPPAPRAQLGRRRCSCCCSPSPPASPATRCPTTCCRAPACASPRPSSSPSRSSASALTYLIFGGEWPGTDIIGRLYPVHILLIPGAIFALLGVHLGARVAPEAHPVRRARPHRAATSSGCACGRCSR